MAAADSAVPVNGGVRPIGSGAATVLRSAGHRRAALGAPPIAGGIAELDAVPPASRDSGASVVMGAWRSPDAHRRGVARRGRQARPASAAAATTGGPGAT